MTVKTKFTNFKLLCLVCATPVAAQANAVTIPATALTDQFLDGDSFMYSCNGALLPNAPEINTCSDSGAALATWSVAATAALPTCSKCCDVIVVRRVAVIAVMFEGF